MTGSGWAHQNPFWHWMVCAEQRFHLFLGKNLRDWTQAGLTRMQQQSRPHRMKGLRCHIQLLRNKGITETHYRIGIWHPLEWSADPERPKLPDIMASALSHLID